MYFVPCLKYNQTLYKLKIYFCTTIPGAFGPGDLYLFAYANEGHAEPQELDRNTVRPNHTFVDRGDGRGPITVLGIDLRVQSPVLPELLKVFCFHACLVLMSYTRVPSSICGSREGPIWHQFLLDQFGTNSIGPILLDQFYSPTTSF